MRGVIPIEFEMNIVFFLEGYKPNLEEKLLLQNAISNLPTTENHEQCFKMSYDKAPMIDFQRFIRLGKDELLGASPNPKPFEYFLYDHFPLKLNKEDYQCVCRIPKKNG